MKAILSWIIVYAAARSYNCFALHYHVTCSSCLGNQAHSSNVCSIENLDSPFKAGGKTAPKPSWQSLSWYIYQKSLNSSAIALNVTWFQDGLQFGLTKGFFLTIVRSSSSASAVKRSFVIRLPNNLKSSDYVFINYPWFGRCEGEDVTPGYSYTFCLNSLPSYLPGRSHHSANVVIDSVTVPNCSDDIHPFLAQVDDCREESEYAEYGFGGSWKDDEDYYFDSEDEESSTSNDYQPSESDDDRFPAIYIALAVTAGLFFVIVCLVLGHFVMKRNFYKPYDAVGFSSKVLVIVSRDGADLEDNLQVEATDALITSLEECCGLTVLSNVRETPHEPISWMDEKMKLCDRVVLVLTPLGKKNFNEKRNEPFTIGLKYLLEERKKNFLRFSFSCRFYVVCFNDDITACIPKSVRSNRIKCIQLSKNLELFYSSLSGKKLQRISDSYVANLRNKIKSINSTFVCY